MWLSRKMFCLCALLALLIAGNAVAQSGVVSIEKVDGLISGTTVQAGANLRFLIRYNNTTGEKGNVSNGFKISSPDGITWDSTTMDSIGPIDNGGTPGDPSDDFSTYFLPFWDITYAFMEYGCDGLGEDSVGFLAAGNPTKANRQMPASWNDTVYAITVWFDGDKSAAGKQICIDSATWFEGGTWVWVGQSLIDYFPAYQGLPGQAYSNGVGAERYGSGYCFDIYAPGLELSTDSLGFSAIAGGPAPAGQNFNVTSTGASFGDQLAFTLVENAPWIVKSPSSGTTPRTVAVTMNTTGLVPGVYIDSIKVESATAYNSPLWVKITLEIAAPAPTISVNKSSFNFVALTGGSNPANQQFIIKNSGGGTLEWTIAKSSAWLGVNPDAGIDSALIDVSADITGLPVGEYFDTLVISDPEATNDPVRIPVKLSLGSSLPMIAVDSAVNHIIVDAPDNAPARSIYIRNAGVGSLTYTLSESSIRLFTVNPMSGSAPDSVHLTFKVLGGIVGQEYFDTLWVTSPEAVNSPYPVVFHFRIVDDPAVLSLNKDTVKFTTYGCRDFGEDLPPSSSFNVTNVGGDNPKVATLNFESDFFSVSPTSSTLNKTFNVFSLYPDVPAGVYYDTIRVTADFAYNSPAYVIVQYTRIDSMPPAMIEILEPNFDIPHQEQAGPVAISTQMINANLGCMPWTIDEEIPWYTPDQVSGSVPTVIGGICQADDLTLGIYADSFYVHSPWATNSPQKVRITLRMWRYHGDWNWDGLLDLSDISAMIHYFQFGNPLPQPEYVVGDLDCTGLIDLSDLTRLIAYFTVSGTTICGNP